MYDNAQLLAAFAAAAAAFTLADGSPKRGDRYRRIAEENAEFLLHHLQTDAGRLFHTWKRRPERALEGTSEGATGENGNQGREGRAKVDGFLEDYAHLAEGLLALYGATFHPAGTRPPTTWSRQPSRASGPRERGFL